MYSPSPYHRRSPGRSTSRAFATGALAALALAGTAAAATVEVVVRADGDPVQAVTVVLKPKGAMTRASVRFLRRLRTDPQGRATFRDVAPGTYTFEVLELRPGLLRPAENPFHPAPVITLVENDEQITIELPIGSGVEVEVDLDVDGNPSGFKAVFRHRDSDFDLVSSIHRDAKRVTRRLAPGVWSVTVEGVPGYLLTGVEHERVPQPGHQVFLDLALDPSPTYLTWRFSAPAKVTGKITATNGDSKQVYVELTLLRPGPWFEDVKRRGGSRYERLGARVVDDFYESVVPDGGWRITPQGETLVESVPPFRDLEVQPGEEARADFTVTLVDPDASRSFRVDVASPAGKRLAGSAVEIYKADGKPPAIFTDTSEVRGIRVPTPPRGDYLLVAGHRDYLEGRILLTDFDPKPDERVRVVLRDGAEVRLEAKDEDEKALAGVVLEVERLGPELHLQVLDEEFLAAKTRRQASTDDSGRTRIPGFYPGSYRAVVSLPGRGGSDLMRVGLTEKELEREVFFELAPNAKVDLHARRRPAATLSLALTCSDNWPLPAAVSAFLVDAAADPESEESLVLRVDNLPLTGPYRDRLELGPLQPGAYRLAIRPAGFTRWTWAFETYDEAEAGEILIDSRQARSKDGVDPGGFGLECGPATDVVPEVPAGTPFPDLFAAELEVRLLDLDEESEIAAPPTVATRAGRFEVRGLPRGRMRFDVVLRHPHLLPEPALRWQTVLELERGTYLELAPWIAAIGGAVQVRGAASVEAVARLASVAADGSVRDDWLEAPLAKGAVLFPSLVPGTYAAVLCRDAECARPLRRWDAVAVVAGETLVLEVGAP